jgi:hypothetical protein
MKAALHFEVEPRGMAEPLPSNASNISKARDEPNYGLQNQT